MNLLKEIYVNGITPEMVKAQEGDCTIRRAARAVLFNASGEIALMHVSRDGYHKLPGGGIEDNETVLETLERELMEEVGARARVLGEVGIIIEYKPCFRQTSYCYIAEVVGELEELTLSEEELNSGFKLEWRNINEVIELLENDRPQSTLGMTIGERDLAFIRECKKQMERKR